MRRKFNVLIIFSIVILSLFSFAEERQKDTLGKVVLMLDLNNDGENDEVVVEYFEDEDNIYARFTSKLLRNENDYIDKVFEKNKIEKEKYKAEFSKFAEENLKQNKVEKFSYEYVENYNKEKPNNLTFNYEYKKNMPEDLDNFIFIRNSVNIRKKPTVKSEIIKRGAYSEKYKVIGKVKAINNGKSEQWYEIEINGEPAYVIANSKYTLKREFDWHDMMKKIEKTNKFIREALENNKIIYVLDDYVPLAGGDGTVKDKFGNRENQSERAYTSLEMTEFINVPDRSIMTILEETEKYIKVKIDVYNGIYYMKKNTRRQLKNSKIKSEITRFIYIDRKSQNEIVVEKNEIDNNWNVVTSSFVTTGKDGETSYATPYGTFLIAFSKPVMQYTGDDNLEIVGDAKNAVRFSGGGYMHSIPSLFEPKETREDRKRYTAKKIGTFPESHKCVRHYDDQIKFIYDWLGNSTPNHKYNHRVPIVPTIVIVK